MKISVIIPVLNEEKHLGAALASLVAEQSPDEVIVADGGSVDRTLEAVRPPVRVVLSERGRAAQMNAGAAAARGDVFVFLHADSKLPPDGMRKIRDFFRSGRGRAGRFRARFDDPHPLLRFFAAQTRFHFFSYGDQGFFVHRELFERLGGYRTDVPFEDIDFYSRLSKIERPVIFREAVTTSARRFLRKGIMRQKLINIILTSMYYCGVKTRWIERCKESWYRDERETHGLQGS